MRVPATAEKFRNYIGGQWTEPSTGEYEPNTNPADNNEVIGLFPRSGRDDARAAIDAAARAFPAWAATPAPERGRVIARAVEIIRARIDEFARALTREEGKVFNEARGEILKGLNLLEFYAGAGFRIHGRTIPSEMPATFTYTLRQPVGVVALISPWNFPFAIPVWKTAPALVAGCTAVLKPASNTPYTSQLFVKALEDAGLPKGCLNLVTGPGSSVGDELVNNPTVKAISFTGSNGVGIRMYEQAARQGKKVTAEMGGKNAVVVLDDADLDLAVPGIVQGAFGSTGQRCTATSRVVATKGVQEKLLDRVAAEVRKIRVGNGLEPGVQMGPAVDAAQLKTDLDYIEIARKEGAELVLGGERLQGPEYDRGHFVAPTIFRGVTSRMRIAQEEVFGPVLAFLEAGSFEEAVAIANDSPFGLTSSIYSQNANACMRYVERCQAGMVHVNQPTVGGEAQLPFGGIKATGVGEKEMSEEGLNFFTYTKTVFFDYTGSKRETNIY
jgi:aldehyde dehydrogenase (NAD+)